jgi:hypothetical protein
MKKKNPSIAPLHYQYSLLPKENIPTIYKQFPIDYRTQEIEQYEVLFLHRLMKKNYGPPSEIEYDKVRTKQLQDGRYISIGREWKYYVTTSSGDIFQVGTDDVHTRVKICHVMPQIDDDKPKGNQLQKGQKFIDDLLREAQRQNQILNIKNEFENATLTLMHNVYLINYRSAQLMLEYADDNEQHLKDEFLRYDARDSLTPEQNDHIHKFSPALGMYYAASLSYFFMALEGLVNILYYAFLKEEIRVEFFGRERPLSESLDIRTKIVLMPFLCNGFKSKQKPSFLKQLSRLTKYRNFFFHAKIEDSLKSATFIEDGFPYRCVLEKDSNAVMPSLKTHLTRESVSEFKNIVDSMVREILPMMELGSKHLVEKLVLESLELPFWRDKTGAMNFGTRKG